MPLSYYFLLLTTPCEYVHSVIAIPNFSRDKFLSEFTKALVDGYDFCSVSATPRRPVPRFDNPPYVQPMWTDYHLMRLEGASDQYVNMPHSE